jgi:hypothetical protein
MRDFLQEYLERGYHSIVRLNWGLHEETGGFQTETETEESVAKTADGRFVRISAQSVRDYDPGAGAPEVSVSESYIDEGVYRRATDGKPLLDTPEVRDAFQQKKAKQLGYRQLLESAPRCPQHDFKMKIKPGRYGPFWSCPKYSGGCRQKQNLSSVQKALLAKSGMGN